MTEYGYKRWRYISYTVVGVSLGIIKYKRKKKTTSSTLKEGRTITIIQGGSFLLTLVRIEVTLQIKVSFIIMIQINQLFKKIQSDKF